MPVELIAIKNFDGGLVTYFDPLDLKPEQFQEAFNIFNDGNGVVKIRPKHSIYISDIGGGDINTGATLFGYFSKHNSAGAQAETWWRIFQNTGKNIHRQTGTVSVEAKTINTVSIQGVAKYTAQDGVLRIYDDSNSASIPSWFGCLKGKKFFNNNFVWGTNDSVSSDDDSTYGVNGGGWYGAYTEIRKPTMYTTRKFVTGDSFITGANPASLPQGRYDVMLAGKTVSAASNVGFPNNDKFDLFCTLEYDESQESQPTYADKTKWVSWTWNSGSGYSSVSLMLAVNQKINKRISAIKLYRKAQSKGGALDNGDLILLAKIDINGGITAQGGISNWSAKLNDAATDSLACHYIAVNLRREDIENTVDTYYSESGLKQTEDPVTLNIKQIRSVIIANNRTFIGGFSYLDNSGNKHTYNDRIIFSPVNRYDTFSPNVYYIDVGENDGDDITGMAFWRGVLLVFKNRRTYLIDISSADISNWRYIDKYEQAGALNQNYIVTTPYGIAFANENQVTHFDGEKFIELSLPIKNLWQTDLELSYGLAFHKKYNLLYVEMRDGYGIYYFFSNNSWIQGSEGWDEGSSPLYDETINDVISLYYTGACAEKSANEKEDTNVIIRHFDSGLYSSTYLKTKWFSLNTPETNKKWLNAYVTYKGSVSVYWYKDGATSASVAGTGANSVFNTVQIPINKKAKIACLDVNLKSASTEIYEVGMTYRLMRGIK